jgi:uncharacterized protein involved in exopolysaccharide biosynthesis
MSDHNYNLFDLIHVLSKWKKPIIYATLITAILSAIISFIIPVYYKSTAMFYPYNLNGFDPRNIDEPSNIYGDNEDTDRILLIARSAAVEDQLIKKFDLYKRYNIDTSQKYAHTNLIDELRGNLGIVRNERSAIEINVFDKDPKVAADLANETVYLIDQINKAPVKENYLRILNILKNQVDSKYSELDSLSNSLRNLKKQSQYKNVNSYFDDIKNMDVRVTTHLLEVLNMKEKYERAASFYNNDLPSIFIVEPAVAAERKAKPVRWLIVVSSTLVILVLISLAAIVMEVYNKYESQIHEDRS